MPLSRSKARTLGPLGLDPSADSSHAVHGDLGLQLLAEAPSTPLPQGALLAQHRLASEGPRSSAADCGSLGEAMQPSPPSMGPKPSILASLLSLLVKPFFMGGTLGRSKAMSWSEDSIFSDYSLPMLPRSPSPKSLAGALPPG